MVSRGNVAQDQRVLASRTGGPTPEWLDGITDRVGETPDGAADLLSFFQVRPISAALARTGYTVEKDIMVLTQIIEQCPDDKVRILARDRLREMTREALEAENALRQITATHVQRDGDITHAVQVKTSHMMGTLNKLADKYGPKDIEHGRTDNGPTDGPSPPASRGILDAPGPPFDDHGTSVDSITAGKVRGSC